jgi:transcription initiation factor TFIID subunit 5
MGNPPNIQNLIASIGPVGAEEILSLDPTDKQEGFRDLEAWVDGSLDMYRVSTVRSNSYNTMLIFD